MAESDTRSDALKALSDAATPGHWKAWRDGNSYLLGGKVVGASELRPVPRPYNPAWIGYEDPATAKRTHHTAHLTDQDADFISALVNAYRAGEIGVVSERGASSEELTRLREIEHLAWHLMDDSEENASTGKVTIKPMREDYDRLAELLPEDHP